MVNPSNELYLALGNLCNELGFNTYRALPDLEVAYPFVVINYYQVIKTNVKADIGETVSVDLDFWSTIKQQNDLREMLNKVKAYNRIQTPHCTFKLRENQVNYQLREDTSIPNTKLWHGILTLPFYLTAKKEN